ncbi:MAG: cupin domain-containing protein, partial [Gammaproteobacteria bacterium]|nr:cupin domain-containing protein [Gammaproteobacteria bacterium]
MKINNFDMDLFLADYWQKKPLVVRNAFSEPFWLDPDDLAGLSLEADAESRIISQEENVWKVEHGPFDESTYSRLPEKNWTLLVQAVDQWVPQLQQLMSGFNFLPSWRLDDVMVSYAPVGGTVSQHFDFFDVFLIQGEGSRKWQI